MDKSKLLSTTPIVAGLSLQESMPIAPTVQHRPAPGKQQSGTTNSDLIM
jgi:hypothetical protein